MTEQLRTKRRGKAGQSWYVDETYVRVKGKWCYLYRAIDADGNLVDSRLSEKRDMEAAQQFFRTGSRRCWPNPGTGHDGRSCLLPASSA
jgi:putative transposase